MRKLVTLILVAVAGAAVVKHLRDREVEPAWHHL
jgi:hypothetical protein